MDKREYTPEEIENLTVVSTKDLPEQSIFGLNFTQAPRRKPKRKSIEDPAMNPELQGQEYEPIDLTWREKWAMYKAAVAVIFPAAILIIAVMSALMFSMLYFWGGFN